MTNSPTESTGGGNWLGATPRPLAGDTRAISLFFALIASVSLGRILLRSPTIPRSENSKIGAFASLLIATMFSEDCIPTLCWIAPEIPAARYSLGATVLPVWPICAAYGYQPASTTARVAATALLPPNAAARSSASLKPSALPSPRPPATRMSAPSMSTSAPRCSPRSTIFACVDHGEYSTSTSTTSAEPPFDDTISNALIRPMMIPRSPLYLDTEICESWRIGRSATSLPSSARTEMTSIVTPACLRAARPAPISNPSSPPPNSAYDCPWSSITFAITSITGWARPSSPLARNTLVAPYAPSD